MTTPLTFVHLTDLHVGNPAVPDPSLLSETTDTLRTVLGAVKALDPPPAFVVVSGDLTNRGDSGSYSHLRGLFAEADLPMPVLLALGNHDRRDPFYRAMLDRTEGGSDPYDHDAVIDGLHVVVLDTSVAGRIGGTLLPTQVDWLAARLDAVPGPHLIVMHHGPMLDPDLPDTAWETIGAEPSEALRAVLAGRNDVVGILTGHIHYDRVSHWHGVPVVTATGHHNATDVLYSEGLRSLAGAAFAVGTVRPSGLTIAFAPLPSDRRELGRADAAMVRGFNDRVDPHWGEDT